MKREASFVFRISYLVTHRLHFVARGSYFVARDSSFITRISSLRGGKDYRDAREFFVVGTTVQSHIRAIKQERGIRRRAIRAQVGRGDIQNEDVLIIGREAVATTNLGS